MHIGANGQLYIYSVFRASTYCSAYKQKVNVVKLFMENRLQMIWKGKQQRLALFSTGSFVHAASTLIEQRMLTYIEDYFLGCSYLSETFFSLW